MYVQAFSLGIYMPKCFDLGLKPWEEAKEMSLQWTLSVLEVWNQKQAVTCGVSKANGEKEAVKEAWERKGKPGRVFSFFFTDGRRGVADTESARGGSKSKIRVACFNRAPNAEENPLSLRVLGVCTHIIRPASVF